MWRTRERHGRIFVPSIQSPPAYVHTNTDMYGGSETYTVTHRESSHAKHLCASGAVFCRVSLRVSLIRLRRDVVGASLVRVRV